MAMCTAVTTYRAVLNDRGDESCRQIRSDMFNLHLMSPYSLPKFLKRINSLAFTNIDNSSRIKIYDNGLVYMTFFYSKLINADVPHPFQRW